MPRQTQGTLLVLAGILVIILVSWLVWLRPRPPIATTTPEQPQYLADQEYQQRVSAVLADLAASPETAWKQQLASSVQSLQGLKVSAQVKYDHLLLFTALDVWQADDLTVAKKDNVRTKLQTFANRQPWSQATIESLITKGNLAS